MKIKIKKAQSILEYAGLVAAVAAAFVAMRAYVQRGVQANLNLIEDKINASTASRSGN